MSNTPTQKPVSPEKVRKIKEKALERGWGDDGVIVDLMKEAGYSAGNTKILKLQKLLKEWKNQEVTTARAEERSRISEEIAKKIAWVESEMLGEKPFSIAAAKQILKELKKTMINPTSQGAE